MASIWQRLSDRHFRGRLFNAPAIRVAAPVVSGAYASFIAYPDGYSEVAVDPQLFLGHPDIDGSAPAAGRWRFIEDLLLHEAIHCAVHRLGRDDGPHHGGSFATLAAGINADLGLHPPPDTDWANWPYSTRPADYYLGAFRPSHARPPAA